MLAIRTIFSRIRFIWIAGALCVLAITWIVLPPWSVMQPAQQLAVHIHDRNDQPLYEVRDDESGSYSFVSLEDVPLSFINALISIEDRDFYTHRGFSVRAIARAAWQNVYAGEIVSGGSTITQQLVRLRLPPHKRTILYKMREVVLAWKLELYLSKHQILEAYINEAYFGHQAYGIGAATRVMFNQSPHELSLAQSALLTGLIQSPSAYNPFRFPERAKERQNRVLQAMYSNHVIDDSALTDAMNEPLTYARGNVEIRAPHFVQWLRTQRPDAFATSGTVQTTIDLSLQTEIERIIERKLEELKDRNVTSAAVVVIDVHTGDLRAMVGSADYFSQENDGAVNVAISPRQPASTMKPFTYALALADGDTAATVVPDIETQFFTQDGNPYIPRNYDYGYHGLVRYREALANSYNIAAVRTLEKVGVSRLMKFLQAAGITTLTQTPEHYGLALTLGDAEMSLLELSTAYAVFPRNGETLHLRLLADDPFTEGDHILDPRVAWLITDILSDHTARLPEFGTDSPLNLDRPVAVKTGTTRNSRDNWTIGYTPDVVVGVWVGNADNTPMRATSGVTGAGPIFHDVMLAATREFPVKEFTQPAGITRATICRLSGKLPTELCPHTMNEWFIDGTKPTDVDTIYQSIPLDRRNGLRASSSCDASFVESRTFAVFPAELSLWARENGWPQPPSTYSPLCGERPTSSSSDFLHIVHPQQNDSFILDPLIPDQHETIIFQAEASGLNQVEWYVNGVSVGKTAGPSFRMQWKPKPGRFTIEVKAGELSDKRTIEVLGE